MNINKILDTMPELKGTPKQVAWANDIREKSFASLQKFNPDSESYKDASTRILVQQLMKIGYKLEVTEETKKQLKSREIKRKLAETMYNEIFERISSVVDADTFIRHRPLLNAFELFPDLSHSHLRYYKDGSFLMEIDEKYYNEGLGWKI